MEKTNQLFRMTTLYIYMGQKLT